MREDFFEKMFPNGFLIVYPVKRNESVNMKVHCPNDDKANRLLWDIYKLILEESKTDEQHS